MSSARAFAWRAATSVGAVRLWQLARCRSVLTVIGFHRVLHPDDDRWPWAIPEFTITNRLLSDALEFLARRYTIVDIGRVLEAIDGTRPLPPRPLLLTIDDGWRDAVDVAAPILSRLGMPSLLFVAVGHVGTEHGIWQNELHARLHFNELPELQEVIAPQLPAVRALADDARTFDALCDLLEPLHPAERRALLHRCGELPDRRDSPQFVTVDDLRQAGALGMALGLHGLTHERLTGAVNLDHELVGAREQLAAWVGERPASLRALSFPHGRYGPDLVARCGEAGYAALFTSELCVNPTAPPRPAPQLHGRLWLGQRALQSAHGGLAEPALYQRLLRAPRHAPSPLPSPWFRA